MKKYGRIFPVPCGWCMSCRIDRRNAWEQRIMFECQNKKTTFLTLTYDDEHLPVSPSGFATLRKDDVQKFFKRLRRNFDRYSSGRQFKYFAVGEYGDSTSRPHYHIIMMGLDFQECFPLYVKSWNKCSPAEVISKPLKNGGIRYVLKYLDKQIHGNKALEVYGDTEPPFNLMSKGIGSKYFEDNFDDIVKNGGYSWHGVIRPLPKYYVDTFRLWKTQKYIDDKAKNVFRQYNKSKRLGFDSVDDMNEKLGAVREHHFVVDARNSFHPVEMEISHGDRDVTGLLNQLDEVRK